MPTTIPVSDVARWVIEDDGTARFIFEGTAAPHRVSVGPIPWTEVHVGDLIVHMLKAGYIDPQAPDVLREGAAMVGYPLGGKTWQVPAPFRIRDAIEGVRTAPVESTYVDKVRFGYVVRHRYGRWLALDLDLVPVPLAGARADDTRRDGLYPTREEAVHRVTANYTPTGPETRHQAVVQASALYEEAGAIYSHLELLQTLLREEGRNEEAGTLDLPLARAFQLMERRQAAMSAI